MLPANSSVLWREMTNFFDEEGCHKLVKTPLTSTAVTHPGMDIDIFIECIRIQEQNKLFNIK